MLPLPVMLLLQLLLFVLLWLLKLMVSGDRICEAVVCGGDVTAGADATAVAAVTVDDREFGHDSYRRWCDSGMNY